MFLCHVPWWDIKTHKRDHYGCMFPDYILHGHNKLSWVKLKFCNLLLVTAVVSTANMGHVLTRVLFWKIMVRWASYMSILWGLSLWKMICKMTTNSKKFLIYCNFQLYSQCDQQSHTVICSLCTTTVKQQITVDFLHDWIQLTVFSKVYVVANIQTSTS